MHTYRHEGSAPRTATEFRRRVKAGLLRVNPGCTVKFIGRTRRFPATASQHPDSVAFLVEVHVQRGHRVEVMLGSSWRDGSRAADGRAGAGHVEASPIGNREVWA